MAEEVVTMDGTIHHLHTVPDHQASLAQSPRVLEHRQDKGVAEVAVLASGPVRRLEQQEVTAQVISMGAGLLKLSAERGSAHLRGLVAEAGLDRAVAVAFSQAQVVDLRHLRVVDMRALALGAHDAGRSQSAIASSCCD